MKQENIKTNVLNRLYDNYNMKRLLILFISIFCILVAYAEHVSFDEAKQVALIFLISCKQKDSTQIFTQNSGKSLTAIKTHDKNISILGKAPLYLIQLDEGGWALLASDKRIKPILAYSLDGIFNDCDMPDNLKALLADYESSIQYVQEQRLDISSHYGWDIIHSESARQTYILSHRNNDVFIERLHNIKWEQGRSSSICTNAYNALCPQYANVECGRNLVGCVATALGQVLWNYQWPVSASIPLVVDSLGNWGNPIYYEDSYYEWNVMPAKLDSLSPNIAATHVAALLRDCGYSTHTRYRYNNSYSQTDTTVVNALNGIFGYSANSIYIQRRDYTSSSWTNIIKNEIDNMRPVLYGADGYQRPDFINLIGHSFVIYGYNESNMFMINWGWGDRNNTTDYYSLDNLVVSDNLNTFSFIINHHAIIGIEPDYCALQKINPNEQWGNNFSKSYIGNIEIGNRTIPSNVSGTITASNSIRLSHGFEVQQGANVHFTISGTPCNSRSNIQNTSSYQQQKRKQTTEDNSHSHMSSLKLTPNPVNAILHIQIEEELSWVKIYTLNGQCVLQTPQTDIDVSALPQGMYILRAITTSGTLRQEKFIKE